MHTFDSQCVSHLSTSNCREKSVLTILQFLKKLNRLISLSTKVDPAKNPTAPKNFRQKLLHSLSQAKYNYHINFQPILSSLRQLRIIWVKKEFDSKPVYKKNFLKTKIKSYGNEATDLHDKEIPKVDSNYICLAVISLGSALKKLKTIIIKRF